MSAEFEEVMKRSPKNLQNIVNKLTDKFYLNVFDATTQEDYHQSSTDNFSKHYFVNEEGLIIKSKDDDAIYEFLVSEEQNRLLLIYNEVEPENTKKQWSSWDDDESDVHLNHFDTDTVESLDDNDYYNDSPNKLDLSDISSLLGEELAINNNFDM